jgi:hypothetical protein
MCWLSRGGREYYEAMSCKTTCGCIGGNRRLYEKIQRIANLVIANIGFVDLGVANIGLTNLGIANLSIANITLVEVGQNVTIPFMTACDL